MPLQKLEFRPGIDREVTSYTNEGGWYDCDKVRFRLGTPEKIGGWEKVSGEYFLGTCRSLKPWTALDGERLIGVGTNEKYYIEDGGAFFDITPVDNSTSGTASVAAISASITISGDITDTDTSITLSSTTNFPESGVIQIGSETIFYGDIDSNDLINCQRGFDGTTAASHTSGDSVFVSTIKVTDVGHGSSSGSYVTLSGMTALGGNVTADILNQEYLVRFVVDDDNYLIDAREVATVSSITTETGYTPTYVFANTSDTGNGAGGTPVADYQVNIGSDTAFSGTGWGAGKWSRLAWGSASPLTSAVEETLRIWEHDTFGEDLLINPRGGNIYYWDKSSGTSSRAVALEDLVGATNAPTVANQVLVANVERHVIAFGCDSQTDVGVQNPLLIRFSSQGSSVDWNAASTTNSAGELTLGSGDEIVKAVETRNDTLVFTDISLYALQYLGDPYYFGIRLISENLTVAGPNAIINIDDTVYWMGSGEFYSFSGSVNRIPCTVRSYVFDDFNQSQSDKVIAAANSEFGEVWWFYASADSSENNKYVAYNYEDNVWFYGDLPRTAWVDRSISDFPIAASIDNLLYYQENGFDDGSTTPASSIDSFIESSQMSIGNGDDFAFIGRLIPDLTFKNSTSASASVDFTIKARNFPGGNYLQEDDEAVTKTASTPVEQFTNQVYMRMRGRSFTFRIDSDETGMTWRLGTPRVDVRSDGRR